jgi:hypothetical protein
MSNPWLSHVKSYQQENDCTYKEAMSRAKSTYNKDMNGGSISSIGKSINKTFNRTSKTINKGVTRTANQSVNALTKVVNKSVNTIDDVYQKIFNGRVELSPKVKLAIKNNGSATITNIQIWRNPVQSGIIKALNVVSLGKFGRRFAKEDYNTMFHLGLAIKLNNGRTILLEKNEIINIDINPSKKKGTEEMPVHQIPPNLTLFELLDNAMKRVGERKLLIYSARDSNCQDFALALLQSSNILSSENSIFIKQETKHLFDKLTTLRKVSNSLTDVGRYAQVAVQGGNVKKKNY